MATRIIAIANHKGGVGKTTSAASIGEALARMGHSTLLVDLDAQQNLTGIYTDEDSVTAGVYEAMTGQAPELPIMSVGDNLSLLPATLALAGADTDLSGAIAREGLLRGLLAPLKGYEYMIMDCPPSLGIVTVNALVAATGLYIPLTAEALPMKGLAMLENVAAKVASTANPGLAVSGVFITRYNRRKLNNAVLGSIRQRYGDRVCRTVIRECIAVAEAPLCGGVFAHAPNSNGAEDYTALAQEIARREAAATA